jgi:hypothetical protein
MTDDDSVGALLRGLVWTLLALPVVAVGMGWLGAARAQAGMPGQRIRLTLLVVLTASLLLLWAGLAWTPVIGPDYSSRRFATITVNLVAMAATTFVAARTQGPGRGSMVAGGAWLTLAWFYMLAVGSVA